MCKLCKWENPKKWRYFALPRMNYRRIKRAMTNLVGMGCFYPPIRCGLSQLGDAGNRKIQPSLSKDNHGPNTTLW